MVEHCSLCLRTRARCHSLKKPHAQTHITKTPRPNTTSQNNAHNSRPTTMARTNLSPGRGDDDDRRGDNDDRRGGNDDRRGGDTTRRNTSKRQTSPSTEKRAKKKKNDTTAKTKTGPKQNDGDDDNVTRQDSATDENAAEGGVSAENDGNATDDNVEGEEISNNPVRIPGFPCLEKQVIRSITNTPPFFAVTRALNLKTITPYHQAVYKKRRTVLLKCISLKS